MPRTERLAMILTTEADREAASQLASALLDRRVVACVTTLPVESAYRWDGEVVVAEEAQLLIKTTQGGVDSAVEAIEELHSYEVPEIVVLEAGTSASYHRWLAAAVGDAMEADGVIPSTT